MCLRPIPTSPLHMAKQRPLLELAAPVAPAVTPLCQSGLSTPRKRKRQPGWDFAQRTQVIQFSQERKSKEGNIAGAIKDEDRPNELVMVSRTSIDFSLG
ncbi:hypothetical protein NHQ30_000681 [Ciborinia camelliae]|nr:hypothetical protein NHQ30_000681 [Ciborinia camelliae]